jgi:diguanylate cyclase (GGDEF)-like protein
MKPTAGVLRARRAAYVAVAALLALGAPAGLLVVRWADSERHDVAALVREVRSDLATFAYVTLSTIVVFSAFGYVLGRQADALLEISHADSLTGLRNRRAFEERLAEELARAARYREPLSLLVADVDGLKAINDRGGHRAGDVALRRMAEALRAGARQTDLVARVGGDEFAVIAPRTDAAAAAALAERIRSLVMTRGEFPLTVSIGVATTRGGQPPAAFLREVADTALYAAKRGGRNRVESA